jgi:hypothetical protein
MRREEVAREQRAQTRISMPITVMGRLGLWPNRRHTRDCIAAHARSTPRVPSAIPRPVRRDVPTVPIRAPGGRGALGSPLEPAPR